MKKILLLLSLFILSNCSQVDENKIKDSSNTNIDTFLEIKQNEIVTRKNNTEILEERLSNSWSIINQLSNTKVVNNISTEELIQETIKVKEDIEVNLSVLENITLEQWDIEIQDEATIQDQYIEETTNEDIEELIDLLLENN